MAIRVNDPSAMEAVKRFNQGSTSSPTFQPEPEEQGWGFGEGDVLSAASSNLSSQLLHNLASIVDDPDASRYATRLGRQSALRAAEEEKKLGTAGKLVSGAATYIPTIAAGMVNPIAGGVVAAGQGRGQILTQQDLDTGEYDTSAANLGGAAIGVIDAATGGLASKLPVKGFLAKRALEAGEDSISSGSQQSVTNIATDRDATEGLADAMLMGAAGGQVLRRGVDTVKMAANPTETLNNIKGSFKTKQKEISTDSDLGRSIIDVDDSVSRVLNSADDKPSNRIKVIENAYDVTANKGGGAAVRDAIRVFQDNGIENTLAAYNYDYSPDLAKSNTKQSLIKHLGYDERAGNDAKKIASNARMSFYKGKEAQEAGNTAQSYFSQLKEKGDTVISDARGVFNSNTAYIKGVIDNLPQGTHQEIKDAYTKLHSKLQTLESASHEYSTNNINTNTQILTTAKTAARLATELGEFDKLKGLSDKGVFNPVHDAMVLRNMRQMLESEKASFGNMSPDITKEKPYSYGLGDVMQDVALGAIASPALPIARRIAGMGLHEIGSKRSQSKIQEAKKKSSEVYDQLAHLDRRLTDKKTIEMDNALKTGETEIAAKVSEKGLEESGIVVPQVETQPVTVVPTKTVDKELANLNRRLVDNGVVEPVPEPIAPVAKPVDTTLATLSTKVAPKKAVEEVTEIPSQKVDEDIPQVEEATTGLPEAPKFEDNSSKLSTFELAKKRIEEQIQEAESFPRRSAEQYGEIVSLQNKLKGYDEFVTSQSEKFGIDKDTLANLIEANGGPDLFNGSNSSAKLKRIVDDYNKAAGAEKSRDANEIAKEIEEAAKVAAAAKKDAIEKQASIDGEGFVMQNKALGHDVEVLNRIIKESIHPTSGKFDKTTAKNLLKKHVTQEIEDKKKEQLSSTGGIDYSRLTHDNVKTIMDDFLKKSGIDQIKDQEISSVLRKLYMSNNISKNAPAPTLSTVLSSMRKIEDILVKREKAAIEKAELDEMAYNAKLKKMSERGDTDSISEKSLSIMMKQAKSLVKAERKAIELAEQHRLELEKQNKKYTKLDSEIKELNKKLVNEETDKVESFVERNLADGIPEHLVNKAVELALESASKTRAKSFDPIVAKNNLKTLVKQFKKGPEKVRVESPTESTPVNPNTAEIEKMANIVEEVLTKNPDKVNAFEEIKMAHLIPGSKAPNEKLLELAGLTLGVSRVIKDYKKSNMYKVISEVVEEAVERRELYPNKPEYWYTQDQYLRIRNHMNEGIDSAYSGGINPQLSTIIIGKRVSTEDLLTQTQINEEIRLGGSKGMLERTKGILSKASKDVNRPVRK